jgi:hypothetical protein
MIRAFLVWSLGWLSLLTCWAVTGKYRTWCAHAHAKDWHRFVRLIDRAVHWLDGPDHCQRQRDKWG